MRHGLCSQMNQTLQAQLQEAQHKLQELISVNRELDSANRQLQTANQKLEDQLDSGERHLGAHGRVSIVLDLFSL